MSKGTQFERDMCREFSLWWTDGKRDDVFWRTSGSGARATTRAKCDKRTADSYGDMMACDEEGKPFTRFILTEFKKGYTKDLSVLNIVDGKQSTPILTEWWEKNEKTREESNRHFGILVFRRDYRKICIVVDSYMFGLLERYIGGWTETDMIDVTFVKLDSRIVIVDLFEFFKWCSGETMKTFIEDEKTLKGYL